MGQEKEKLRISKLRRLTMKKRNYIFLSIILILIISITACSGDNNKRKEDASGGNSQGSEELKEKDLKEVSLVLDWTPNTNHTGLYVAQSQGYFKREGLEVNIMQPPEDGAETIVAGGGADFGISFQDYMTFALSAEDPLPITAIAATIQHNTSGIISLKETGIDSPDKMMGKNYATWNMDIEKAIIRKMVEDSGGNFDNVELIPSTVTDEVTALQTGVDSIWVYYAWAGIATEVAGLETNFMEIADYGQELDFYSPVIIANNNYLQENEETVKAFLRAVKDGYEYAIDNPKAAADILFEAVPELNKDILYSSQEWLSDKYKAEVDQWGFIDLERWDGFYGWLLDLGIIEIPIDSGVGFTNEYLPE